MRLLGRREVHQISSLGTPAQSDPSDQAPGPTVADDDDDDDEDEDETYYPSQDYGDNSNIDPEYRPSKKELKGADKEGDK